MHVKLTLHVNKFLIALINNLTLLTNHGYDGESMVTMGLVVRGPHHSGDG